MKAKSVHAILEAIANEAIPPGEVDSWPRVRGGWEEARHARPRRSMSGAPRRLVTPALILTGLLVIVLILVGPERALAALRGLLGYIPGIGLVDESAGLRVLAEPVAIERDGISIAVEDVVVDPDQTVILFTVEGIPAEAYTHSEDDPGCSPNPSLRLPNSTVLETLGAQAGGWGSGYQARFTFGPIPADINEAVFSLRCIEGTRPGAAPEDWEFHLRFESAPADLAIAPVLEIQPSPEATQVVSGPGEMGLYLTNVIELPSDFILVGEFRQGDELPGAIIHGIFEWPDITDAQGRTLPFETPSDLDLGSNEMDVFPWAYQVPKGFANPLAITLQAVPVEYFVDLTFQFDAGSNPVAGQTGTLDQIVEIAGYQVRLVQADRTEHGYEFTFEADPSVQMVSVDDEVHQPIGGSGGGYGGEVVAIIEYEPPVPSGMLEYHIRRLVARHEGPWTLTWEAPEGTEGAGELEHPRACLDLETWQRITESPPQLPGSLSGRLILYGPIESEEAGLAPGDFGIYDVDLASGDRQLLGPGTWPALSPDASPVVYNWTDGLYLRDLQTGESRLIPGTLGSDYNPRWSPDGSEIAFVRSADFNLYIMDAEGSNFHRVSEGREYEQLIGWMSTGRSLIYVFQSGEDEMRLNYLNLDTGGVEEGVVFDKSKAGGAAVSPDGQRIAYTASVRGTVGYGLFLANIHGSDPRLLAHSDQWSISAPRWSPSGDWLMVNITNDELPNPEIGLALNHPDACDAFPQSGIEGHLFGRTR